MKLLVSFTARQTVIQAAVMQEAEPDRAIFITTPLAAENGWHEKKDIVARLKRGEPVPYTNVFISEDLSLSTLVETLKRHIHLAAKKYSVTEIYFDASSGKGIHRIVISNYLKVFAEKRDIDFFLIYFDPDTRVINRVCICSGSFSQYKSSFSIDWHLKERLSIYGATMTDSLPIFDKENNYFKDSKEQFDELYTNLCSSMILRAFFSSYENIKSLVDIKKELKDFIIESHIEEQVDKFIQRIFGIMPHLKKDVISTREFIRGTLLDFFKKMVSKKDFMRPSFSYDFRSGIGKNYKKYTNELSDTVFTKISSLGLISDTTDLKKDVAHFLGVLFNKIIDKINSISDMKNIEFPETVFNRFKQKYVKDFQKESQLNTRSQISIVFEKIVSYAVYKAIMDNSLLKESIASVHQNVKLDGKSNSLIEIDTLIVFRNGYIHIFEAKSSHVSNKDINSKILVLKRYLGESAGMDIVFPFTETDILHFENKDEPYLRKFHSKGLKNVNTWGNFFSSTDKNVIPIDKIKEKLVDLALKYS
jgi:hypothetical protein